jgi:hypothetical protein
MINSVFEGLRQRRFDDIHLEIRSTTWSNCVIEVEKLLGEKEM